MGVSRGKRAARGESDAAGRPACQVGWLRDPSPSTQKSRRALDYSPSSPVDSCVTSIESCHSLASWLIEAETGTWSFKALITSPPPLSNLPWLLIAF